jgi:putative transposase
VLKAFKYPLRPTKKQERLLSETLDECRWLYHHFLDRCKTFWEKRQQAINYHAQAISIPNIKPSRVSATPMRGGSSYIA